MPEILTYAMVQFGGSTSTLFEPLALVAEVNPSLQQELNHHQQALDHYRAAEWAQAQAGFEQLAADHPDQALYKLYLHRIANLLARPPDAAWDGVFALTEK